MKKYVALLSLISLTIAAPLSVNADSIDTKLNETNTKIDSLREQKQTAEDQLAELDNQITVLETEREKTLEEKVSLEEEINELIKEVDALTKAIEKRTEKLSDQARATQVNQASNSMLQVVLEADDFSDAITKSLAYGRLMKANDDIAVSQKEDKEELSVKKTSLDEKLVLVEEKTAALKVQQEDLSAKRYDQAILAKEVEASLATEETTKASLLEEKAEAEERKRKAEEAAKAQAVKEQEAQDKLAKQAEEQKELEQQASTPISNGGSSVQGGGGGSPAATSGEFQAPLSSLIVTSSYGYRLDPTGFSGTRHDGIDFAGFSGQDVYASLEGTVVTAGFDGSAGNYVIVQHDNGKYTYYLHLSRTSVSVGDYLNTGQSLGGMGTTGNSTGVHLHFGIATTPNWSGFMDPAPFLGL